MVYLESTSTDPYFNLALEEYAFERLDRSKQYFILWQNDNTIVVGKYQNTAEEVNQRYVEEHGIRVARRLSGGGAVYHDKGNLNFTFIVDQDSAPDFNFDVFVVPVVKTLEQLGVHAEFNGRNDITINGQKFSGNSQYAKGGRLLHHGCIMVDSDLATVADALKVKKAKFDSKSVKSVRSRVTTINANAPEPITMERFKELLKGYILETEGLETLTLTREQLKEVQALRDAKYATWEWNYGFSPDYKLRKEQKLAGGLVTVLMQAREGRIERVKFYGDFFGNGDLSELEGALQGQALDRSLETVLEQLDVGYYMSQITPREIYQLLMY